jgi:hypothetical protein
MWESMRWVDATVPGADEARNLPNAAEQEQE